MKWIIFVVVLFVCGAAQAGKDIVHQIKNKVDSIIKEIDSLDAIITKNMDELRKRNVHTEVFVDVNDDPESVVAVNREIPFKWVKGYFAAFKEELKNAEDKK